eukprot:GEMP01141513.1.p1 GENE.GEMP01141513.1~~GEMP01141513.1.p1  ORF type:complete len:102 (-),score=2.64 GEMP01141513.1:47-352(-)
MIAVAERYVLGKRWIAEALTKKKVAHKQDIRLFVSRFFVADDHTPLRFYKNGLNKNRYILRGGKIQTTQSRNPPRHPFSSPHYILRNLRVKQKTRVSVRGY